MAGYKEEEEKVQDKVSKTKEMKCREYTHKLVKEEEGVVQSVTKLNLFIFFSFGISWFQTFLSEC